MVRRSLSERSWLRLRFLAPPAWLFSFVINNIIFVFVFMFVIVMINIIRMSVIIIIVTANAMAFESQE